MDPLYVDQNGVKKIIAGISILPVSTRPTLRAQRDRDLSGPGGPGALRVNPSRGAPDLVLGQGPAAFEHHVRVIMVARGHRAVPVALGPPATRRGWHHDGRRPPCPASKAPSAS